MTYILVYTYAQVYIRMHVCVNCMDLSLALSLSLFLSLSICIYTSLTLCLSLAPSFCLVLCACILFTIMFTTTFDTCANACPLYSRACLWDPGHSGRFQGGLDIRSLARQRTTAGLQRFLGTVNLSSTLLQSPSRQYTIFYPWGISVC